MNTMKFYKTRRVAGGARELVTLRVKIDQRAGLYAPNEKRGTSRRDACVSARAGGYCRTKAAALKAVA